MSAPDPDDGEPPAKQRAIDPIAPTEHPWNLPAEIGLLHCSCHPVDGDQLWRASGFVIEFDESSMIGTIVSSATVAFPECGFPDIEKMVEINESRIARDAYHGIARLQPHSTCYKLCPGDTIIGLGRQSMEPFGLQANRGIYNVEGWAALPRICQEMQRATFINTYTALGGPAINNKGSVIGMLFHSLSFTPFLPSNIILKWWEYFKTTGKYCRSIIRFVGCNMHNARSSRWVKVPTSLHEGLDGILVEMASREVLSEGLQEKDLIIRCNGKHVATNLQSTHGYFVKWEMEGSNCAFVNRCMFLFPSIRAKMCSSDAFFFLNQRKEKGSKLFSIYISPLI